MTGPQLKTWRTAATLSLREVAQLLGNEVTHTTLSRWENSSDDVPQWAADKVLNTTKITLPLGELHQILDYCRETDQPFHEVLAQALRQFITANKFTLDKPKETLSPATDKARSIATTTSFVMEKPAAYGSNDTVEVEVNATAQDHAEEALLRQLQQQKKKPATGK